MALVVYQHQQNIPGLGEVPEYHVAHILFEDFLKQQLPELEPNQ
jgi:hypothetical protein